MAQAKAGGVAQLDGRGDLYSLACVLYEMLAGDPPFTGWSAQAILARQEFEPLPRLRTVRDTVPEGLAQAGGGGAAEGAPGRVAPGARLRRGLGQARAHPGARAAPPPP